MRRAIVTAAAVLLASGLPQGGVLPLRLTGPALAQATAGASTRTQAEMDAEVRLERAGYSQIRDLMTTKAGVIAKAMRGGSEVSVLVDSYGRIREFPGR